MASVSSVQWKQGTIPISFIKYHWGIYRLQDIYSCSQWRKSAKRKYRFRPPNANTLDHLIL